MGLRALVESDTQEQEETFVTKLGSVLRVFAARHHSVRTIVWNLRAVGFARVKIAQGTSSASAIRVLSIPGVYKPQGDSALLAEALSAAHLKPGAAVLDVCTGSGVLDRGSTPGCRNGHRGGRLTARLDLHTAERPASPCTGSHASR